MKPPEPQPAAQPQAPKVVRLLLCPRPAGLTDEEWAQRTEAFIRRQQAAGQPSKKEE